MFSITITKTCGRADGEGDADGADGAGSWLGRGEAVGPAARSVVDTHGVTTVRWTDVRFAGMIALDQPRSGPDLFTATVRLSPDGQILEEKLGR